MMLTRTPCLFWSRYSVDSEPVEKHGGIPSYIHTGRKPFFRTILLGSSFPTPAALRMRPTMIAMTNRIGPKGLADDANIRSGILTQK
jgi:hypothetical protein